MKKTIRIFSLPSHATKERTTGVDFVRIIQPSKFLNGYEDEDTKFEVESWDINDPATTNWSEVAKAFDIVYLNYINNAWGFAAMGSMMEKYGKKIVFDLDDALWNMKPDNSSYGVYQKGGQAIKDITSMCNHVDYITVTNSYLKNVVLTNTTKTKDKVKVFPNYIDLDTLYTHRSPFKETLEVNLLHFGSTTHFYDLATQGFKEGTTKIMREFPNVTLTTIGAFMPEYKDLFGPRYTQGWGNSDVYKWIKERFPVELDKADILVTPLVDSVYDRCKSSIKFLEGSSAMKPGVWQKIRQYEEVVSHGQNGFLAYTSEEWYESIKKLVLDATLRKNIAKNAFETVKNDWTIQNHVKEYADFFKFIV